MKENPRKSVRIGREKVEKTEELERDSEGKAARWRVKRMCRRRRTRS